MVTLEALDESVILVPAPFMELAVVPDDDFAGDVELDDVP